MSAPGIMQRFQYAVLPLAVLLAVGLPFYASFADKPFLVIFATRLLIYALAAVSLNLILGYGGMVSFGHAAYLSIGAYSVAIPSVSGIHDGLIHLLIAITASAAIGLVTGAIALRTKGVAFIMITLAFAQMIFFFIYSLKQYGGDDGLNIRVASRIAGVSLAGNQTQYWCALLALTAAAFGTHRLLQSNFGMVLRGIKSNEERMRALGFPTYRYKLAIYVVSCAICGVAGFLLANLTQFASPAYGTWMVSGELMLMVALGGPGTVGGPIAGAACILILEDILKRMTIHWMGVLGLLIAFLGIVMQRGLWARRTG